MPVWAYFRSRGRCFADSEMFPAARCNNSQNPDCLAAADQKGRFVTRIFRRPRPGLLVVTAITVVAGVVGSPAPNAQAFYVHNHERTW
jgi:hypothetical protein